MMLIDLSVVGCTFHVECDEKDGSLLNSIYHSLRDAAGNPKFTYHITPAPSENASMKIDRALPQTASVQADFLYNFDKDLIIQTQKLRSDLYFVHAAVLAADDHALALVAPSGSGKSTTTWGLLHYGFHYLSDELAPIDPTTMEVYAFPRALCMKGRFPPCYPPPANAITIGQVTFLPTSTLPGPTVPEPLPLESIVFLRAFEQGQSPELRPMSMADATVRLLTNALNSLAHSANGLDAAMRIVTTARCFELRAGDLRSTCELVTSLFHPGSGNSSAAALSH